MTPYYDDGQVTIYHADCRDVLPTLGNVGAVVTSPPYNLGHGRWDMGGAGCVPRLQGIGYADNIPHESYVEWQRHVLTALFAVCCDGASLFYNHKPRTVSGRLIHPVCWLADDAIGWTLRQEIVWDRGSTHNHEPRLYWQEDERVYWLTKGAPSLPPSPIGFPTIWRLRYAEAANPHPAPFPHGLVVRCLAAVPESVSVLDPFMGSGTTLRAAKDLGRRAIGIELEERYCEIAVKRLAQTVLPFDLAS